MRRSRAAASCTGAGNTPVQITSTACIDWLGYTLPGDTSTRQIWEGGSEIAWESQPGRGRFGYEFIYKWQSVELWKGHKSSGPHVDASGHGCRDIEAAAIGEGHAFAWEKHLEWLTHWGARVSRLDLAIDVLGGGVDIPALADAIAQGRCISRWKETSWREMKGIGPSVRPGHTLYMGSPKSDSMLRIYDKKAEQKQADDAPPWVRVEFQLRHEAAISMSRVIAKGGLEAGIACARSYVDFLGSDGHSLPAWDAAMHSATAAPLKVLKRGGTLDSMQTWLDSSVGQSLAVLLEAYGGDLDVLAAMATAGREKWNAKHRSMAAQARKQGQERGSEAGDLTERV